MFAYGAIDCLVEVSPNSIIIASFADEYIYISNKIVLTRLWCVKFNLFLMWWGIEYQSFLGNYWQYVMELPWKTLLSFDHKRLLIVSWTLATCVSCEIVQRFVIHQIIRSSLVMCCSQSSMMLKWDFLFLWLVANGCMDGESHLKAVAGLVVALWLTACPCSRLCYT